MDRLIMDKCLTEMRNSGSEEAFEQLYIESKNGVFSFAYSFVKNIHDAEDIMQQSFINARKYVDGYVPGTNAVAWLLEIVKNNCLNHIKKKNRETCLDEADNNTNGYEDDYHGEKYVLDLIKDNLEEIDARIVLLRLVNGFKHREIAGILDLPLGTVLWKYNQSIKKLKKKLKEKDYE